jgi:Carboxypeptidase regulatory-like domain
MVDRFENFRAPAIPAAIQRDRWEDILRLSIWACALFLGLPILISKPVEAQVLYGSMVGTVTDQSGSAVPGASVVITNLETNDARNAQTDSGGVYTISTVPAGNFKVSVTKQGYNTFVTNSVEVTANNVVRVDPKLTVGAVSQTVEVQSAATAQLQTDTADVHSELSSTALATLPQATRTYEGVFNLVPGMLPPTGQLAGGTNNPSKSMNFGANGTGTTGPNVRIDGVSATAPRQQYQTSFVPSVEAIQSVNIVTNSPDAEQGLSGGPSVTVQLKSGSNGVHGAFYWYNVTSATEARNYFQPVGQKPPHLVDNDTGGWIGGPIIRDKLFYWAGYEGDYALQGYAGVISVPTPQMLAGNLSQSTTPIYDPATGNPTTGTGKTPFPGNIIPTNRISPVAKILNSYAPAPNIPGLPNNNLSTVQPTTYNLHKIDTKIDYQATTKLRVSGRYGYQPYNNVQQPLFGPFLGGASSGWSAFSPNGAGNYEQHGATLAVSGSATYVFSPALVADFTFGATQAHQLLFPVQTNVKVGLDVLGIPGTNVGSLPFAGGLPQFDINGYPSSTSVTWGYSYTPLEYKDPVFEYTGNVTKIIGSHNIRAGEDIINVHMNHIETNPTVFQFSGGATSLPGGASPGIYQGVADYLLGLPTTTNNSALGVPEVEWRYWNISFYVRDQWQMSHRMTVNYGLRYEYYPVPSVVNPGMPFNNLVYQPNNPTVSLCGVNGNSGNCGINVSKKLFAPSIGVSYRATDKIVVRSGYALSPMQVQMANTALYSYPLTTQQVYNGANSYLAASTTLATGFPLIATPDFAAGTLPIPRGTGNLATSPKNFTRGYFQTYNLTVQNDFGHGLIFQIGYVGTHGVHLDNAVNFNYGTLGGGSASQPFNQYGITAATTSFEPAFSDGYNSLQVTLQKQLSHGLYFQSAYTWSRDIQAGYTFNGTNETGAQAIAIPQYWYLNKQVDANDRTHNFIISATYAIPVGEGRQYLTHGPAAWVLGGWSVNGIFSHVSGLPFSVSASAASCNCPGSTQRANQVKSNAAKVGRGVLGQPYFDPTAFAPVTTVAFGTASFNSLRGPGATNLDANVFRDFQIWERVNMQFRAEGYNVSNTPHFAVPGANVSNATLVNGVATASGGYDQITALNPLGRLIGPRYLKFGLRFTF